MIEIFANVSSDNLNTQFFKQIPSTIAIIKIHRFEFHALQFKTEHLFSNIKFNYYLVTSLDVEERAIISTAYFSKKYRLKKYWRSKKMDEELLSYISKEFLNFLIKNKFDD